MEELQGEIEYVQTGRKMGQFFFLPTPPNKGHSPIPIQFPILLLDLQRVPPLASNPPPTSSREA